MSKWDVAQVAFELAREAESIYVKASWQPRYDIAQHGGPPVPDAIDVEMDKLSVARCAAEEVVIATPAPDLPAVIWKIDYARKRWEDSEDWPEDWWSAVMDDLRRLAA